MFKLGLIYVSIVVGWTVVSGVFLSYAVILLHLVEKRVGCLDVVRLSAKWCTVEVMVKVVNGNRAQTLADGIGISVNDMH